MLHVIFTSTDACSAGPPPYPTETALIINGQRKILFSGAIHYPEAHLTYESPPFSSNTRTSSGLLGLVEKAKDGGLDAVETYVFWDGHEPSPGKYNFEGRYNLVRFVKTARDAGLYVVLRVGPYVCAEWNFGGLPVWLKYVPGISFRTDNEPFKAAMEGFVRKIVEMMKAESLFESQGGPIILAQACSWHPLLCPIRLLRYYLPLIENEYGPESRSLGSAGHTYMTWAAEMAVGLNTGVPWTMCKEEDAPDPVINTCNGFYCDSFTPNKPYKPMMWTEAWTGWFSEFGGTVKKRPVEDLAFAVARFVQSGGSFINYYMYHGGTNFGRTAGGPFITTSYDYDAPIDEYGVIREPKYGHLKELHRAIKLCEGALVSSNPTVTSLGTYQQAHVFSSGNGECAAFLSNFDSNAVARVLFNDMHYTLPAWSISILPDCRNVVFNTAKVRCFNGDNSLFTTVGLLEQINVTRDMTDYLWYITRILSQRRKTSRSQCTVCWHALHIFVNGRLSGSAYGTRENKRFMYTGNVDLRAGSNRIALLSVAVGLPNVGAHYETWNTGVLGPVILHGLNEGSRDLSWQKWSYQVGLKGEAMDLNSLEGTSSVEWMKGSLVAQSGQPLTWYKAYFDAPGGDEPLALDMGSMGKGQVWVNGENDRCGGCNYAGTFRPPKCQTGCRAPTQRWYHVPRSWLRPTGNLLVVFEEVGGAAERISLVRRSVAGVCADVSEWHPTVKNWQIERYGKPETHHLPKVHLRCSPGQSITAIKFASFGTPSGSCGSFQEGACHSPNSRSILEKVFRAGEVYDGDICWQLRGDPCPNVMKRIAVEAVCAPVN
ncbi:unnamed protein product [Spirodela intermedia]|uniref:beta-galactosidase n=1 Tax=Spirodela intermedia TaxID=51605 RepID=A0A7I8JAW2_SPIIN|nr:unnamed protein product [Spirodela intermedia]CAA6667234.1 unnamed protein product [Spirodela intermedia]